MSLKDFIQAKMATAEAHAVWLTQSDSSISIPSGDALKVAYIPGTTYKNAALVGVHVGKTGPGRLRAFRGAANTPFTTPGGFVIEPLTDLPAFSPSVSHEVDAAGLYGIGFDGFVTLDLWDSPVIVRNGAGGGRIELSIQNDGGSAQFVRTVLKLVVWE